MSGTRASALFAVAHFVVVVVVAGLPRQARFVGNRYRYERGLRRDELLHRGVPQGYLRYAERLSQEPYLTVEDDRRSAFAAS